MSVASTTCPQCAATLRPARPVAAGKKLKCPKCTAVFTVPPQTAIVADVTPLMAAVPVAMPVSGSVNKQKLVIGLSVGGVVLVGAIILIAVLAGGSSPESGEDQRSGKPKPRGKRGNTVNDKIAEMQNGWTIEDRLQAIHDVPRMGPEGRKAIAPLCGLVNGEKDLTIRIAAVKALGDFGPEAHGAIPTLQVTEKNATDPLLALAAREALMKVDPANDRLNKNAAALAGLLKDSSEDQRLHACRKLGELREEAWPGVGALAGALARDESPKVRAAAAWALGQIGPDKGFAASTDLNRGLRDPNRDVAIAVAKALVEWGPGGEWNEGPLIEAAKNKNLELSQAAKLALRKRSPSRYKRETPFDRNDPVEAALADLGSAEKGKRDAAVAALSTATPVVKHREEVHEMLKELLKNTVIPVDEKTAVVDAMVHWNSQNLAATLRTALGDRDKPETAMARRADLFAGLAKIKYENAAGIGAEYLGTPDHEAASNFIRSLGPKADVEKAVLRFIDNADKDVRARAASLLKDVGGMASLRPLQDFIRREPDNRIGPESLKAVLARLEKAGVARNTIDEALRYPLWAAKRQHWARSACMALSPKGELVAESDTFAIYIRDTADGKEIAKIPNPSGGLFGIAINPEGTRIAGVTLNEVNHDGRVYLWDIRTGKEVGVTFKGNAVARVAFSPDGKKLVAVVSDRQPDGSKRSNFVGIWDANTGQDQKTISTGFAKGIGALAFSPDGKHLATGGDGVVRIWNVESGGQVAECKVGVAIASLAFSGDGKRLVTSGFSGGALKVWQTTTGKELIALSSQDASPSVAFSPNGKWIATAHSHATARVWDAATGKELVALKGISGTMIAVAFSPDNNRLYTLDLGGNDGDHGLLAWDLRTLLTEK